MKLTIFLLVFFPISLFGQISKEPISLRIGYSSTNIIFKEAYEPSINIFGRVFKTGKTFVADGPEFGISKHINNRVFLDISLSSFSGRDTKAKVNSSENYYRLKGFQTAATINYLVRDSTKRLRINLGAGVQYLKAHLQQYETTASNNGQVTNQITDFNISEFQLSLRPGIQFRIIPNLFVCFIVKVSISPKGRYSDNPCLSVKYSFRNKK
jgi:hypothetical protein